MNYQVLVLYRNKLTSWLLPRLIFAVTYSLFTGGLLLLLNQIGFFEAATVVALQTFVIGLYVNNIFRRCLLEMRILFRKVSLIKLILAQLDIPLVIVLFLTSVGTSLVDQKQPVVFGVVGAIGGILVAVQCFFGIHMVTG